MGTSARRARPTRRTPVGQQVRADHTLAARHRHDPPERHAVQHVAHVEQERRQHDLEPADAAAEQADRAHLGTAREHEQRERLRLDDRRPASRASTAYANANGATPSQSGIIARKP
jgi:hypothetical protein